MSGDLSALIAARIRSQGPLRFDEYLELALYEPDGGFYSGGGGAGRGRDFLTSPEVGPLFGAVLARAVDTWWVDAGRPGRWTVVDAGAGPGRLLPALMAAGPACGDVLEPVAVERSQALRDHLPDGVERRDHLPSGPFTGVVVANELLDNVPWRLLERAGRGWSEVRLDVDPDGGLVEVIEPAAGEAVARADGLAPNAALGARIPLQDGAVAWLAEALGRVRRGRVVVLDYGSTTAALASRPRQEWMRTYRGHERGTDPLDRPGTQDVTVEVATDQLAGVRAPDRHRPQSEFLRAHGLDGLVVEGRQVWAERAHLGDLEALRGRSRTSEAEALTDPAGLGAFRVQEWQV